MKLSDYTVTILNNFISFNDGIVIRKGNILSTTTLAMNVAVIATVPDEFPVDCAIYDMRKFMSLVSLFDDPSFEFGPYSLSISDKIRNVELTYCDKDCIRHIEDQEFAYIEPIESFLLNKEDLVGILKALNILSNPDLEIYGDGEKIYLKAKNSKFDEMSNSDTFKLEVGKTDKTFEVTIKAENLKMLPINYTVSVSEPQVLFTSIDENIKYYLATEA